MKKRKIKGIILTAAMMLLSVQNVFAAKENVIDSERKGSFTVYKYDMTAAEQDDVNISKEMFLNNGREDEKAKELLKNYVIPGVEFTYLRIGEMHTENQNGKIQLLYDIPDQLERILELKNYRENHRYTSTELNEALQNIHNEKKDQLEDYIEKTPDKRRMPLTDENGKTLATGLKLGTYLVIETKVPANVQTTIDPFFVSLPMTDVGKEWLYDVEIYPKNQTGIPDLDKLVKQNDDDGKLPYTDVATGSEGDIMNYILVSHLPKITSQATYLTKYEFTDCMDKAISYNKDVSIYFYDSEMEARRNKRENAIHVWEKNNNFFKTKYEEENSSKQKMSVEITEEGLYEINRNYSELWMVVNYSCKIQSDESPLLGDYGNINDVKLEWKRTNMEESDVLEDRAKVYTFGLDIKKTFSDNKGKATDVKFVLKNKTDGHYIKAKGENGKYYVTDSEKGTQEKEGTIFIPSEEGNLKINGLEANTYILTEIATSNGYSLLKESMEIDISSTIDNIIPSQTTLYDIVDKKNNPNKNLIETAEQLAKAKINGKEAHMKEFISEKGIISPNASLELTVLNNKIFQLPQTGGTGTWIFTMTGCIVALAGVIVITKKSKREDG